MKKPARLLSLLLALLITFSAAAPCMQGNVPVASAYATNALAADSRFLQTCNYPSGSVSKTADWIGLIESLYNSVWEYKTEVDVSAYKIPVDKVNLHYLSDTIHDSPKLLRLISSYKYSTDESANVVKRLYLTYRYS